MQICFLSSAHPPFDKRVFDKEARSLAAAGFDVTHLAPYKETFDRKIDGVRVITFPAGKRIVDRILNLPRLAWYAAKLNSNCYHCNEVDSWFVGVCLKLARGGRVVFDVHEHYPSTFADSRFPKWCRPIVQTTIRLLMRVLARFTDYLVFAKRSVGVDFAGFEEKQVLVQNFVSSKYASAGEIAESRGTTVLAIHTGLISRVRGWPQLIEAMKLMKYKDFGLRVIGTFNDGTLQTFQAAVESAGLAAKVEVCEWLPFETAQRIVSESQIGLILFQPGIQNHVYALPHKMFDYMAAGLPIVVPEFALELRDIVRDGDCGLLVDCADSHAIAQVLDYLCMNPDERTRLGQNGRRAILEKYNWEVESEALAGMYRRMEARN